MSTTGDQDFIAGFRTRCQIIVGALITGVVVMLGIATFVAQQQPAAARPGAGAMAVDAQGNPADANLDDRPNNGQDVASILTWMAVGLAAVMLPMSFVLPGLIAQQNRRAIVAGTWPMVKGGSSAVPIASEALQTDASKLAIVYQTQLIIGAAMNEGVAFFAAIVYMIGKNPIALGLAILLLGGLIVRFPTRDRVALWIDRQQEHLILDRQAAI
jgi:hypothetical protein